MQSVTRRFLCTTVPVPSKKAWYSDDNIAQFFLYACVTLTTLRANDILERMKKMEVSLVNLEWSVQKLKDKKEAKTLSE